MLHAKLHRLATPIVTFAVSTMPTYAFAGGAGGAMPWEQPLDTISASLSGPVARAIGIAAVVGAGLAFAFTEGGGILRKAIGIVFGLAIAFSATTFITTLFGAGGGAVLPW